MRPIKFAVVGLAFLGLALMAGAADDNAKTIVGKWKVVKSEDAPPDATAEFTKDGKLVLQFKLKGKDLKLEGTYKLDGKKITSVISFGGQTKTDTATIKKLSQDDLILQDDKGKDDEYKRIKK